MKPAAMLLHANRRFPGSTEMHVLSDSDLPEFCLVIGIGVSTRLTQAPIAHSGDYDTYARDCLVIVVSGASKWQFFDSSSGDLLLPVALH